MSTGKAADSEQEAREASRPDERATLRGVRRFAGGEEYLPYRSTLSEMIKLFSKSKNGRFMASEGPLIHSPTLPAQIAEASPESEGQELSADEYEMIKSQAVALLCAELLDSPEAHLDYISRAVAGALSKDVGTR